MVRTVFNYSTAWWRDRGVGRWVVRMLIYKVGNSGSHTETDKKFIRFK